MPFLKVFIPPIYRSLMAMVLLCSFNLFAAEMPLVSAVSGATAATALTEEHQPAPDADPLVIDSSREYVSEKFVNFASRVDAFFGSDRNYQESNKSVLQFDLTRVFDNAAGNKVVPTFRAKFHLPALQKRMQSWLKNVHLLVESNPDQNPSGTAPGASASPTTGKGRVSMFREVSTPDSYGVALRLENAEDAPSRLSADGGLKLVNADDISKLNNTSIDPFVRTRGSVKDVWGAVQVQLAESVFLFNSIGLGESTQFDMDYRFSDPLLFRSTSIASWLRDNPNFNLHQDFSVYQTLDEQASLLYQLAANGVSRPQAQVSEYIALLLYRQRFYRDWMFIELSPQIHYLKTNDYRPNAQFIVRLEVLFSK
jgi:hypothetical protein